MANEVGKDGWISFATSSSGGTSPSTAAANYIDSWTLSPKLNLAEVTAYGNYSRAYAATQREWAVTASGTLDPDVAQQQSILQIMAQSTATNYTVYVRLQASTGYYSGKALLTGIGPNSRVSDKVSVTYTLQGTSNLTFT